MSMLNVHGPFHDALNAGHLISQDVRRTPRCQESWRQWFFLVEFSVARLSKLHKSPSDFVNQSGNQTRLQNA